MKLKKKKRVIFIILGIIFIISGILVFCFSSFHTTKSTNEKKEQEQGITICLDQEIVATLSEKIAAFRTTDVYLYRDLKMEDMDPDTLKVIAMNYKDLFNNLEEIEDDGVMIKTIPNQTLRDSYFELFSKIKEYYPSSFSTPNCGSFAYDYNSSVYKNAEITCNPISSYYVHQIQEVIEYSNTIKVNVRVAYYNEVESRLYDNAESSSYQTIDSSLDDALTTLNWKSYPLYQYTFLKNDRETNVYQIEKIDE